MGGRALALVAPAALVTMGLRAARRPGGLAKRALEPGLAALALMLAGCPGPAGPLPRCADAWKEIPAADRTYDFAKDAKPTARGNEGYGRFADRVRRDRCAKDWTVLVYMAADAEDLGGPALADLRAMEDPGAATGSTAQADVVAELDRKDPAGALRLHLFRAPAAGEGVRSPIVEARGKGKAPTEERLTRFLTWGMERYPSDHYAVVVWGHGLGWRPAIVNAGAAGPVRYDRAGTTGGIAFDETLGTVLDTPALRRALVTAARERRGGQPFDLYASDACLMQSVEVAGELAGAARFVVGSEQVEEDYVGLPYRTWLPLVNGSIPLPALEVCPPADVACRMAAALPRALHEEQARAATPAPGITLSAVDEAKVAGELVPALGRLGAAIEGYAREDDLRRINLQVALGVDHGPMRGTPGFRGGTRDVGVFLARLRAEVEREPGAAETPARKALFAAIDEARAALGRAVIAGELGPRYRAPGFEGMSGLSVWLPHDAGELRGRAAFFAPSLLYRQTPSFGGFLDRVFAPPPR